MIKSLKVLIILICALVGFLLSSSAHELCHAIIAHIAGHQVVDLSLTPIGDRAHVSFKGETTSAWRAAIYSSGMLASVAVGALGMLLVGFSCQKALITRFGIFIFIPMLLQIIPWIVIPVAIGFGYDFSRDDIGKTIHYSGLNPFIVSLLSLVLGIVLILIVVWTMKKIFRANKSLEVMLLADARDAPQF